MFVKDVQKGIIEIRGTKFNYEIFIKPHEHDEATKSYIVNRFGDRIVKGAVCLNVTKTIVEETLHSGDYTAIGFVKNIKSHDEASGALQYYDWCAKGAPQLWIGDLCRVTKIEPKPPVSPVEALLHAFTQVAKENRLNKIHLMVEKVEPGISVLPKIYNKYGFNETADICIVDGYIIMEKPINNTKCGGAKKTRKRTQSRTKKRRI